MKTFTINLKDFMGLAHTMEVRARDKKSARTKAMQTLRECGQNRLYTIKSVTL